MAPVMKYNQPTGEPARKVSANTMAVALVAVIGLVLKVNFPAYYDDSVILAVTPVVAGVFGYWFKDAA